MDAKTNRDASRMVRSQLQARHISDSRVLEAMCRVPRHQFAAAPHHCCYRDHPVPIGFGQTMSQPYVVGLMTELLDLSGQERVLEVGTGSGYQTAILSELSAEVCTIELIPALQQRARGVLEELGCDNIRFRYGDGSLGWQDGAPFDRILVAAAALSLPTLLIDQLGDNGIMVVPVGPIDNEQVLTTVRRSHGAIRVVPGISCRFVPMRTSTVWSTTSTCGELA